MSRRGPRSWVGRSCGAGCSRARRGRCCAGRSGLAALLVTVLVTAFSGSLWAAIAAIAGLAGVWFVVWPSSESEPRLDRALRARRARARARAG